MYSTRRFRFCTAAQISCLIAVFGFTACVSTSRERPQSLFNGKTLDGWVQRGGDAEYTVEDGCIVGHSVDSSENSFLCTERSYRDFVLNLEVKADTGLNSGIQVRSHCFDHPTTFFRNGKTNTIPAGRVHGYQVEVDDRPARRWSGGIYDEARRGWLRTLENNEPAQRAFRFGKWNRYRIECVGPTIKTWVNSVPTATLSDADPAGGFIALQVHGEKESGLKVRFRNISLREIGSRSAPKPEAAR